MKELDKLYSMYKFTKNPDKILKWLCNNFNNIDLSNHIYRDCCDIAAKHLFNNKLGKWTEEEAKFLIVFFTKQYLGKHWLKKEVNIVFLTQEEYNEKTNGKGGAIYKNATGTNPCIYFSPEMLLYLKSNKVLDVFEVLTTIFHECTHAIQDACFRHEVIGYFETEELYDYEKYVMILEIMISKMDKDFYNNNYSHLLIENDANKKGVMEAAKIIRMYNSYAYERYFEYFVEKFKDDYEKIMLEDYEMVIDNQKYKRTPENLDEICAPFVQKYPNFIKTFPILQFAYHRNGTKKNIIELYYDRNKWLDNCLDKDIIDRLYKLLANNKKFEQDGNFSIKKEIEQLAIYVAKHKNYDEFLKELLLYRLRKIGTSDKEIEEFLAFLGFQNGRIGELDDKRQSK